MKDAFAGRALRDPEAFQLKAYLAHAARDGTPPLPDHDFLYLGVLGAFASLGAIGMAWQGRMRGVRANLVKRSHR
jgi:hypothetical protein